MRNLNACRFLTAVLLSGAIALPLFAQDKDTTKKDSNKTASQPSEADMMAMMIELGKPGENHKLLEGMVGSWTYTMKMWMTPDPNTPPTESSGTTVSRSLMGGRYFLSEHNGKMKMPGPDGKLTEVDFSGMGIEGYDNVQKKFVSSWIDNMSTSITRSEGSYDAATKTLTYHAEFEMMPGMKTKVRQVIKITDKDHHTFEWYEDQGGKEVRTMEITYARKK